MPDQHQGDGGTSPSLLERLQAQDQVAWRRFVHLYNTLIRAWCRHSALSVDDIEDVCQEVFRCTANGIAGFWPSGQRGAFRAWLRTITRNCLGEHFRRNAQQPRGFGGSDALEQLHQLPDLGADDSDDARAAETVGLVERTLELIRPEFSDSTWRAFSLVSLNDQSPTEVAGQLSLSVFAVRQACYRVRRRLRQELRDLEE